MKLKGIDGHIPQGQSTEESKPCSLRGTESQLREADKL